MHAHVSNKRKRKKKRKKMKTQIEHRAAVAKNMVVKQAFFFIYIFFPVEQLEFASMATVFTCIFQIRARLPRKISRISKQHKVNVKLNDLKSMRKKEI